LIKQDIRIGFIGAGSIGSLFGGKIASIESNTYSLEVIFFGSKENIEVVNQSGLRIQSNHEIKTIKNIKAYENEKDIELKIESDPTYEFNYMFLTTKAYDIQSALVQYKRLLDVSKWLVILQNGIGNEDIAIQHLKEPKIIRVITTNGALLNKPGQLLHTGKGITKIGFPYLSRYNLETNKLEDFYAELELLKDLLSMAGFKTKIVQDIIKESWEKVIINIGINAFGALTRLTNGELIKSERLKFFIEEAILEAVTVANQKGINLSKKDYVELTYDVARKTAKNKNSMLQDILNGNPTEIDFINGSIVKFGEKLQIKTPINGLLTSLIKGLEQSSS